MSMGDKYGEGDEGNKHEKVGAGGGGFDDNGTAMMADLAMMMTTMMVPILWYHR